MKITKVIDIDYSIVDIILSKDEYSISSENIFLYDESAIKSIATKYINSIVGPHRFSSDVEPLELENNELLISLYFTKL